MSNEVHPYKQIVDLIKRHAKVDKEYQEELIDHYCTLFDEQLKTLENDEALSTVLATIQQTQFKSKSNYMLHLVFTSLLLFTTYFSMHQASTFKVELPVSEVCTLSEPPFGNPLGAFHLDITSKYGKRRHPIAKVMKFHKGIDLKAPLGTPVIAVSEGVVLTSSYDKQKGHYVEIQHDEDYITRYFHLHKSNVTSGQKVNVGEQIGEVGTSGVSMAPHLHYEILKGEQNVDPYDFVKA